MRILIVDDEGSLRMTLSANLELEGFDVETASGGEQALQILARGGIDLVLTDVKMPNMNGVELYRAIRQRNIDIPVLLMTAYALETLIEEAIAEGVFAVLPKPFEIEHVIAVLTRASRRPLVLLIDEEGEGASAIAEGLTTIGVSCSASPEANEAVASVKEKRVDVCVASLSSGAGIVKRLLKEDPSIAVIAVASGAAAGLLREAAAQGAYVCMSKPIRARQLAQAVASARARWQPGRSDGER